MARAIYQYQPINETPDVAIGIMLPLNKSANTRGYDFNESYATGSADGGGVFPQSYTTEDQSISNLKNLLLTSKGERYMQPDFGTDIRNILFEQNTEDLEDFLSDQLRTDIQRWLPYIAVNNVIVLRDANQYTITINLHFRIISSGANLVINILTSDNALIVTEASLDDTAGVQLSQVGSFGAGTTGNLGGGGY